MYDFFFYPWISWGKKKSYIGFFNSALKFKMKMNFKEKMELKAFAHYFSALDTLSHTQLRFFRCQPSPERILRPRPSAEQLAAGSWRPKGLVTKLMEKKIILKVHFHFEL